MAAILICLGGCAEDIVLQTDNSLNLATPGPKWPKKKKDFTKAQKEVFEKHGKPEMFRMVWNPDHRIATRDELQRRPDAKEMKKLPPLTWVYTSRNMEIVFEGTERFSERPLTDEIKLVLKYGDPEDAKTEAGVTQWTFYSVGRMYKLLNGRIIQQKEFPAMGGFMK